MLVYSFIFTVMFSDISIFVLGQGADGGPRLPLIVNGNNVYYFGLIYQGTVAQAESYCRSLNMDLLSIETPEEDAFIEQTLLNMRK
ncbi:unnamed protein product [Callosobruchus maculatus]|uniref:C-type lectin domain-containing protein n=1 Tax=Callosobruchus maculatus TaxID=64391 RepID=A0A653CA42_CALMS|nr:unnamed protein product [Callosobruchus maculatus]